MNWIILACVIYYLYLCLKKLRRKPEFYRTIANIPGLPLIGNAWEVRNPISEYHFFRP